MKTQQVAMLVIKWWFVTRLILGMAGVWAQEYFEPVYGEWRQQWKYSENKILNMWGVWDSGWYVDIAKNGYSLQTETDVQKQVYPGQTNYSFFPLYPLLMRWLGVVTGNVFVAGIIISNLSLLGAGVLLYKIVDLKWNSQLAKMSVIMLFLFPTSFILSGVFSEGLFLMLLLLTWYLALKDQWWGAGIAGAAMTLTRAVGIGVWPAWVFLAIKRNRLGWKTLMPLLGTGSYLLFTYWKLGDFFAYFNLTRNGWRDELVMPIQKIFNYLSSDHPDLIFVSMYTLFTGGLLVMGRKIIKTEYLLVAVGLLIPALFRMELKLVSFPRYTVVVFPLMIILAIWAQKNKLFKYLLMGMCGMLQLLLMILWSNGLVLV